MKQNPTAEQPTALMDTATAAEYLRLSAKTLEKYRSYGGGPLFAKIGRRRVVYRQCDLEAWVAAGLRANTSQTEFLA